VVETGLNGDYYCEPPDYVSQICSYIKYIRYYNNIRAYTVKKISDFHVPSRDVTY